MAVLTHAALVTAAAENWELNTLQAHETLANVVVGGRIDCTTLSISEELVESIISSTLPDLVVVVELLRLVDCIVNWSIGRVLGWTSIEASWCTTGMLLTVASIGSKCTIGILISTRCSGKRLQVSDHCSRLLDIERGWREDKSKNMCFGTSQMRRTYVYRSGPGSLERRGRRLGLALVSGAGQSRRRES